VNDFTQRLIGVWAGVEESVIQDVIDQQHSVSITAFEPQEDIMNIHYDTYY